MFKSNDDKASGNAIGIIFIIMLAVVPAITRLAVVDVSPIEKSLIRSMDKVNDVFSYNKSIALIIFTCLILIASVFDIITRENAKIPNFKRLHFIMILIFAALAALSSVFSKYKPVSFSGISERYEGLWVVLCYCVLFAASSYYVKNKKTLFFLTAGIFMAALIVGSVGFSQLIGKDIFKTEAGARFIFGKYYKPGLSLTVKFSDVYATLYNPNCAGLFSSMLTMFFGAFAIVLPFKNCLKYVSGIFALFMLSILVGSSSAAGAVGLCASISFLGIIGIIYLIKNRNFKAMILSVIFIAAALFAIFRSPSIQQKFEDFANENKNDAYYYKDWQFDGFTSSIVTQAGTFKVIYNPEDKTLRLENYDGNEAASKGNEFQLSNQVFRAEVIDGKIIYLEEISQANGVVFLMGIGEDGLYPLSKKGQPVRENIETFGFEGMEYFASNRGYIWSRSLPVAFKYFILGSGCDTFSFEFPQDDVMGKMHFLGNHYVIVDKPHNMFIQMAVNTGMISFIIFAALNILFIARAVKSMFEKKDKIYIAALAGITGGVVAFLVTACATDSVVSVTPVYFVLLGTGFAVTYIKEDRKEMRC